LAFPYYKALRVGAPDELDRERGYRCPRVLLDAFTAAVRGGSGRRVDAGLLERRAAAQPAPPPLWLAGGIGADNVAAVIDAQRPELIDASSSLEAAPGRKDPHQLRAFFRQLPVAESATSRSTA
jgi:indole-3-glycerol phosphate synthase/phosphoribosylanthranilate isomerase